MESKEDAAVERQKLVPDDGEIEPDDEQPPINNIIIAPSSSSNSAPKTLTQTPISPVLSHKIFSSGETSRTQDSSNCSVGRGNSESGPHSTRLIYINERKTDSSKQSDYKAKARRVQRDQDDSIQSAAPLPSLLHNQLLTHKGSTHNILTTSNPSVPPSPILTTATRAYSSSSAINDSTPHTAPNPPTTSTKTTTTTIPNDPNSNPQHEPHHQSTSPSAGAAKITFDERVLKHHSFISEVPDVRHMERALLGLLEDFHLGKLKAFGSGCTMDQMTDIREQQERLAKLHFELGAGGDPMNSNSNLNAQENMTQLVAKLENLSVSIERLNSGNTNV